MIPRRDPAALMQAFLRLEAAGGLLLIGAATLALVVANSPLAHDYHTLLHAPLGPLSLHGWINDALMALFFLLVGLEIKREMVVGYLANPADRVLPVVGAVAGMAAPALVYLLCAGGEPALVRGWAIPAATDIAFALGVMALLGPRVPPSLKLLLTTLAIVDDMGAVAIIALVYTAGLNLMALAAAAALFAGLLVLNRRGVDRLWPYLLLGAGLWTAVFLSGVHATIAGVLTALAVPLRKDDPEDALRRLEHRLHPWISYAVVPLFGFANAGVSFAGLGLGDLLSPLPLGIAAGLFLGKQAGVFVALRLAVWLRMAQRPAQAGWAQVYGVSLLAGIGFTMSLFIGGLAFTDPLLTEEVKAGVLGGSLLSALAGSAVLLMAPARALHGRS